MPKVTIEIDTDTRHVIPKRMDGSTYAVDWRKLIVQIQLKTRHSLDHDQRQIIFSNLGKIAEAFSEVEWRVPTGGTALDNIKSATQGDK